MAIRAITAEDEKKPVCRGESTDCLRLALLIAFPVISLYLPSLMK